MKGLHDADDNYGVRIARGRPRVRGSFPSSHGSAVDGVALIVNPSDPQLLHYQWGFLHYFLGWLEVNNISRAPSTGPGT